MCGLTGFTGDTPVNPSTLRLLLLANRSRGVHATGVYGEKPGEDAGLYLKDSESADDFIKEPSLNEVLDGSVRVIGHTRHATVGGHTKENAHPFVVTADSGVVVGAHNGWIFPTVFRKTAKDLGLEVPAVDSLLIFQALAKYNMDFDILSKIEGAMALTFTYQNQLYLYRRPSKPLHLTYHREGLYYSSEISPLTQIGAAEEDIWSLPEDTLYVYSGNRITETIPVKKPGVVSMPVDCLPSAFRQKITPEESKLIPYTDPTVDTYRAKTKKDNELPFTPDKPKTKMETSTKVIDGVIAFSPEERKDMFKRWGDAIDDAISNWESDVSLNAKDYKETNSWAMHDPTKAVMILTVKDSAHKNPLPGWGISLYKVKHEAGIHGSWRWVAVDGSFGISGATGLAVLYIPKECFKQNLKIGIHNPLDLSEVVYSHNIQVENPRVLEVTLSVPFRKKEEDETRSDCDSKGGDDLGIPATPSGDCSEGNESLGFRFKGQEHGAAAQTILRLQRKLFAVTADKQIHLRHKKGG